VQKLEDKLDVTFEKLMNEMTEQKSLERLNEKKIQKVEDNLEEKVQKVEDTLERLMQAVVSLTDDQRKSQKILEDLTAMIARAPA
jgi:hypothetical protein